MKNYRYFFQKLGFKNHTTGFIAIPAPLGQPSQHPWDSHPTTLGTAIPAPLGHHLFQSFLVLSQPLWDTCPSTAGIPIPAPLGDSLKNHHNNY